MDLADPENESTILANLSCLEALRTQLLCSATRSTHNKSEVCFLLPSHGSALRNSPFYLTVGLFP